MAVLTAVGMAERKAVLRVVNWAVTRAAPKADLLAVLSVFLTVDSMVVLKAVHSVVLTAGSLAVQKVVQTAVHSAVRWALELWLGFWWAPQSVK